MFFSLDRLVTKNQWLNTKCQQNKTNNNKNLSWHVVFCHWFLGLSNENDKFVKKYSNSVLNLDSVQSGAINASFCLFIVLLNNFAVIKHILRHYNSFTTSCTIKFIRCHHFEWYQRLQFFYSTTTKGQLISKCPFGVFKSSKNQSKSSIPSICIEVLV